MVTLTALAVLRQDEELALQVRAALRNGLTPDQIREVLLQVAIYAGVPAANRAFARYRFGEGEAGHITWWTVPTLAVDCRYTVICECHAAMAKSGAPTSSPCRSPVMTDSPAQLSRDGIHSIGVIGALAGHRQHK